MPGAVFSWFRSLCSNLFCTYSTVKEIEVRNTYVAAIYRTLQFTAIAYIAIYIVWIKKGYQDVQEPHGSSIIKVKGVARVSVADSNSAASKFISVRKAREQLLSLFTSSANNKHALWDSSEYLLPPMENNAFFIATRKTITYNQTLSECPGSSKDALFCNSTYNPCKRGMPTPSAFGVLTGNCLFNRKNEERGSCKINAWCPQEGPNSTDYKVNTDDLQNFSVFIKTIVAFTQYNIKIRTVNENTNFSCRFNTETDSHCPLFSIGYILRKLHEKDSRIDLMALYEHGGLIEIHQNWQCNFDVPKEEKECFPTFTFNLLQSGSDKLSPGVNYRFAEKYLVNGIEHRTLTKIYGLRFVLSISGEGRRFDVVQLFFAIGSGVGYMIIAEIICEFIFTTFHKHRKQYQQSKVKVCHLNQSDKNDPTKRTTIDEPVV